ncbi:PREDICTED: GDSL esterase/lipase At5g03610-like [Ipomoea nil]|uniref:GDSL esterase/lipase At5g03610-like n=1 Tax=Ipomoea nil TaxID=35883 RepID=UPI0009016AF2|nr:PREDICTED: GDSL esterase/lipase At5g03610-like [Ipomoea nil]
MKLSVYFCFFSFFLSLLISGHLGIVEASAEDRHRRRGGFRPTALFVFGDSYADTGNLPKALSSSWKQPYGFTFPGKPSGRFTDGRVFTDFVAKFLGLKSPIPFKFIKYAMHRLQYGMNFAYGGTGVFDTLVPAPNMTTQIDILEKLVKDSVYTKKDLESSLFLVSVAGNDYAYYIATGGTFAGLPAFTGRLMNQLVADLKRIRGLGAKRIAVTSLPPLGCVPRSTAEFSFKHCNATANLGATYHNSVLQKAVVELNKETKASSYVVLDLYTSFSDILLKKQGSRKFWSPLKPCCLGVKSGYFCGDVDAKGVAMYKVCRDPTSAFFWDTVHPSQAGWNAVYTSLRSTLEHISH